jgi:hypothetical protein
LSWHTDVPKSGAYIAFFFSCKNPRYLRSIFVVLNIGVPPLKEAGHLRGILWHGIQRRPTYRHSITQREIGITGERAATFLAALYVEQASAVQLLHCGTDGAVCQTGFLADFGKAGVCVIFPYLTVDVEEHGHGCAV